MTPPNPPPGSSVLLEKLKASYWRKNLLLMGGLLFLWAFFGLGCGILWADYFNQWFLFGTGYPLGFWFAQQGSIIAFVLIILVYALAMNRLDRAHRLEMEAARAGEEQS